MARLDSIRKNGLIPERRHDAFLLALLLAVGLNVAFFAAQALLPHLANLLRALGVAPPVVQEEEFPFVLVDPSFLDEEPPPDDPAATAAVNREARQAGDAPADGEDVYRPEGVDEQLMMEEGNQGEIDPGVDSAGTPELEATGQNADVPAEPEEIPPEPPAEPEAVEAEPTPEEIPEPVVEAIEPAAEPPPPAPEIVEVPEPEEPLPLPEQPEEAAEPVTLPGPAPEPEVPDTPPEPVPQAVEPVEEPVPEADPAPDPTEERIDLAMLPPADSGIFTPEPESVRARAPETQTVAAPVPDQFEVREYVQPEPQPEQRYQPPEPAVRPDGPVRPQRRQREGAPRATFKELGGASTAGGAPPRRSMTGENVDIFDDPYMALLRDRYPEYMMKLGRMLQASLNRTMYLYPAYYANGQAKLQFRIAPDGTVEWHETLYPVDGSDDTLRSIAERTLLEGGPFGPPPAAMLADPAFRRMTMTVNIY